MSGRSRRNTRLEAPLRLFTRAESATFGGYSTSRWTWSAFPRFAKKGRDESFRYPDPKQFKIDAGNNRIFLPKLA